MRAIALLALLYCTIPCTVAWKLSSSSPRSYTGRSLDRSYLKTPPADIFKIIDSNGDRKISLSELTTVSNFGWDDPDASHRARVTFGIAHPLEFIREFDADGDESLSFDEFAISLSDFTSEPSPDVHQTCASHMKSRVDACKTSEILRCNSYIEMAQHICHLDQPSVVQHCVMSSPCASICSCIQHAEKAAHGQATFTLQHPNGQQEKVSSLSAQVNNTEVGFHQPQKRFFWIFLIFAVVEITLLSPIVALISLNTIASNTQKEYKNLDFKVWDGSSTPPQCAAYVFWSNSCGALSSSGARGCSDGGTRLYGNSCIDHFRYGSQACGFLSLGCKSLCYAINPKGCPCSIVDKWIQQDDINYPGNDLQSLRVAQISDCRTACGTSDKCLAYVVPPASEDQNQPNCYLKGALGSFSKSGGTTSFLKVTSNSKFCSTNLGGGEAFGVYDRRDTSISNELSTLPEANITKRVDKFNRNKLWPFDTIDAYLVVAQFLVSLYTELWINQEQLATRTDAVLTSIGARTLEPDPSEPVASRANPRWRFNEAWRLATLFRAILFHASQSTPTPVAAFLDHQGTTNLANALFPSDIRSILRNNEQTIRTGNLAWAGARSSEEPYPGVNSAYVNNLGFFQAGPQGPFSLEAAFILATQLAGINWSTFATTAAAARRPMFWANAIVPEVPRGAFMSQCLTQFSEAQNQNRTIGFLQQAGTATGDPRAGIYFAIDVDGGRNVDENEERNVFVFAMHTIDPHSRIDVPNGSVLTSPSYITITPGTTPPPRERTPQARFIAHAHAAWVPYNRLREFMTQDPNSANRVTFPGYNQVGSFHLYILSEDTSVWPRSAYVNNDTNDPPSKGHDEL